MTEIVEFRLKLILYIYMEIILHQFINSDGSFYRLGARSILNVLKHRRM